MKKILAVLIAISVTPAFSQTVDQSTGVQVFSNYKEVAYVKTVQGGSIIPGKEWEGTRIFKKQDGTCLQIERTDLKILKAGNAQRPEFKEKKTTVACPE